MMAQDRRAFLATLGGVGAAGLLPARAAWGRAGADRGQALFFLGEHGGQVRAASLDLRQGRLAMIGPVAAIPNPTWTVRHPRLPVLYAVSQVGDEKGQNGSVHSFRIDQRNGALSPLGVQDAGGGGTTHLCYDAHSDTLLAANYASGSVASIAIGRDGAPQRLASVVRHGGSGPHPRQKSPHAHGIAVHPGGGHALVADLGADRVFVYALGADHLLHADAAADLALPAGTGPRHLAFHPGGRTAYLLTELTAEIFVLRWDPATARLSIVQRLSADLPGREGAHSVAEVAVSGDGRFVYVSNRGENAVVVLAVDPREGTLQVVQRIAGGGEVPWTLALAPGGRWLLVANERSERIQLFAVDRASGRLRDTGQALDTPKPVCITFDQGA